MLKNKGFTLAELVISMIIIAILSLVAIVSYRVYVKRSIVTEAKALLSEVHAAEQVYHYRTESYYQCNETSRNSILGVDARRNKYFTSFSVNLTSSGDGFSVITTYNGKGLTLNGSKTSTPYIIDNYSGNAD